MSEQIDWSKAPEGADKYNTHNGMFYTGERPYLHVFWNGRWKQSSLVKSNERFVYRPTTPSWSGEGLPPVGVVCGKCYNSPDEYYSVKVLAHDSHYGEVVIYRWVDGPLDGELDQSTMHLNMASGSNAHWSFRPIRTPEQVAADEPDAAIKEIGDMITSVGPTFRDQAARLYDAGYRKP